MINIVGEMFACLKNKIFYLLCAATLMITSAAAIEGGISPQPLPYIMKIIVALASLIFLVFYFGFLPLKRKRKTGENGVMT